MFYYFPLDTASVTIKESDVVVSAVMLSFHCLGMQMSVIGPLCENMTHTHTHTQPFYGPLGFCPGLHG